MVRFAWVALLLAGLSGCGTLITVFDDSPSAPLVYGGVRQEASFLHEVFTTDPDPVGSWGRMFTPLVILDFPFSLVLDTALLPITIPWALLSEDEEEEDEEDTFEEGVEESDEGDPAAD